MNKQIGALTSLRGIAAVIVVVHHFSYYTLPQTGQMLSSYSHFLKNGYLCVDFFFILSGFIMAYVYADNFCDRVSKSDYWTYLRARFARIYPLHLFTLLALIILEVIKVFLLGNNAFIGKFNLTALAANIFLLQAFDLTCPPLFWCNTYWNEPAWSISVEFVIYTVFPFLLYWVLKFKPKGDLIFAIVTLLALLLLIKFTRGNLDAIIGIPSIARCGLESVLGVITYKMYQRRNYPKLISSNLLAVIAIGWIGWIMHSWVDNFRGIHDWLVLPAYSLLILAVSGQSDRTIGGVLNSKILLYIGTISYSIYMVHWCLSESLKMLWLSRFGLIFGNDFNLMQCSISLMIFMLVVVLVSSLTYRFIEVPLRDYLKSKRGIVV
jgi:peptidoglycan/LPS O-acetylase OafA/YrhL